MRIGFDVDGVCYSFVAALRKLLQTKYGIDRPLPDPTQWDFFYPEWGITIEEYKKIYCSNPEYLFNFGQIKPEKLEILNRLKEDGHSLTFITNRIIYCADTAELQKRTAAAKAATSKWFEDNKIPFDHLYVTWEKAKYAKDIDLYVDDYWENLDLMKRANPKLETVLYRRPYNEFRWENYSCVSSFSELYRFVNSWCGSRVSQTAF